MEERVKGLTNQPTLLGVRPSKSLHLVSYYHLLYAMFLASLTLILKVETQTYK